MRENLPIFILVLVIMVLLGFYFFLPDKNIVVKKTSDGELTNSELKVLEKVHEALENASYAVALQLLEPLEKRQNLQVQVLMAESKAFLDKPLGIRIEDLEKGILRDRGLDLAFHLARTFEGIGKADKALEYYNVLLQAKIPPKLRTRILNHKLEIALANGDGKTISNIFKELITENTISAPKAQAILQVLRKKQFLAEYEEIAVLAKRQFNKDPDLLQYLGRVAFERGLHENAIRLFEELVILRPTDSFAHYCLYQLYMPLPKKKSAFLSLERAIVGDVTFMTPAFRSALLLQMAMVAVKEKEFRFAYVFLRNVLTADVRFLAQVDEKILKNLFEFIKNQGNPEEKAFHEVFESFVNGDFSQVEKKLPLLEGQLKDPGLKGDFQKMRFSCHRILAGDQAALEEERELQEKQRAEQEAQAKRNKKPLQSQSDIQKAELIRTEESALHANAKEIQKLKNDLQSKMNDENAVISGGARLLVLGDLEGAKELLNGILQRKPGLPEACFQLGRAMRRQGQEGPAIELARQAITGDGREAKYRGFLALLLADQKDWFRTEDEAKKALALNPRNGEAHLAMFRKYVAVQDFTSASKEMQIISQSPDQLVIKELDELKTTLPSVKQ
ncbi:MAG: hypothetical protein WA705_25380 [Candidatus Ozemobacteraceae bacterium]